MTAQEKAQVLARVAASPLSAREVLRSLRIAGTTYYRWKRRPQMGSGWLGPAHRLPRRQPQSASLAGRPIVSGVTGAFPAPGRHAVSHPWSTHG